MRVLLTLASLAIIYWSGYMLVAKTCDETTALDRLFFCAALVAAVNWIGYLWDTH